MAIGIVGAYNAAEPQTTTSTITTFADVGVGNLCVMYGTTLALHRQLEIRSALEQCVKALVEDGFKKPALAYKLATVSIDAGKGQVVVSEQLATDTPNEGNVSVAYSGTFDNNPASSLNLDITADNFINELLKDVLSAQ